MVVIRVSMAFMIMTTDSLEGAVWLVAYVALGLALARSTAPRQS